MKLNPRQLRFVQEYNVCLNGTEAARRAGYKKPGVASSKLLKNPMIKSAIGNRTRVIVEKYDLSAEEVLRQLFFMVTRRVSEYVYPPGHERAGEVRCVNDMGERAQRTIDGIDQEVRVEYDRDGVEVARVIKNKLRLSPIANATEMALKHKGLFPKEVQEHTHFHTLDYDKLSEPAEPAPNIIETTLAQPSNLPATQ